MFWYCFSCFSSRVCVCLCVAHVHVIFLHFPLGGYGMGLTPSAPKSPHPKYISYVVWVLFLWRSFFKNEIILLVKDSSSTRRWCWEGLSMGQSTLEKTKLKFNTNLASWTMIAKSHRAPVENFLSLLSSHEPCWMGQWQARLAFQLSNQTWW